MLCYPPAETKIPLKVFFQSAAAKVDNAEQSLCSAIGATYCLFGSSGRTLLFHLIKELYKWEKGRRNEILIPAYTCYSVPAAIVKAGLKLRYYDLDPGTLNPVRHSLQSNCSANTLAIISQHLFGIPMELDDIGKIAAEKSVYHIEDAAQAFGGWHRGRALGTTGDFGLFSFGRGKSLPLGACGALSSQRHDVAGIMPPIKNSVNWGPLIMNMITQVAAKPLFYGLAEMLPLGLGETIFDPNFKPGSVPFIQKKMFAPMMICLAELNRHRTEIASVYRNSIKTTSLIVELEGSEPIYTRFPVIAKSGPLPTELWRLGIRRLYPNALTREPRISAYATNADQQFQGAETLAQQLVTLPTHHSIDKRIAGTIAQKIDKWIDP